MARFVRVTERALTGKSSGWDFWFYFWELVEGVLQCPFLFLVVCLLRGTCLCVYICRDVFK